MIYRKIEVALTINYWGPFLLLPYHLWVSLQLLNFCHERREWPYIYPHSFSSCNLMVAVHFYLFFRNSRWEIIRHRFLRRFLEPFFRANSPCYNSLNFYLIDAKLGTDIWYIGSILHLAGFVYICNSIFFIIFFQ